MQGSAAVHIQLETPELEFQRIQSVEHAAVVLSEKHFVLFLEFISEDKNETTGEWEQDVPHYYYINAKREKVCAAEMSFCENMAVFRITIYIDGVSNDPFFYFKSKKKALDVFQKITAWMHDQE